MISEMQNIVSHLVNIGLNYNKSIKHFLILCLICVSLKLYSQDNSFTRDSQISMIVRTYRIADSLCDVHPIDSLLSCDVITFPEFRSHLLIEKAELLTKTFHILDKETKHDSLVFLKHLYDILDCYDLAMKTPACNAATYAIYQRYNFIENLMSVLDLRIDDIWLLYQQDRKYLKSKGFKPDRDGFGSGAYFMKGRENYLGVQFSLYSFYGHENYLESVCDSIIYTRTLRNFPKFVNAFTLSYCRSHNGINDLSLSLIDLCSPIVFSPLNLGYMGGLEQVSGFYFRPTIGLPILGIISISYSYNFMFSKNARTNSEKSLWYFKVSYPITNHRIQKWK